MKNYTSIIILLLLSFSLFAQDEEKTGKSLFRANCQACHAINKNLVGPALKNVHERRDSAWIYRFIKGSQAMVDNGDATAVSLFNEFNQIVMPNQTVSDEEIGLILAYIKKESVAKVAYNPISRPVAHWDGNTNRPMKFSAFLFWIPFTLSVVFVVCIVYILVMLTDMKREKEQQMNV